MSCLGYINLPLCPCPSFREWWQVKGTQNTGRKEAKLKAKLGKRAGLVSRSRSEKGACQGRGVVTFSLLLFSLGKRYLTAFCFFNFLLRGFLLKLGIYKCTFVFIPSLFLGLHPNRLCLVSIPGSHHACEVALFRGIVWVIKIALRPTHTALTI